MAYDAIEELTDDLHDNLAQYQNEKRTAIMHAMSATPYAAYTRTQSMTANVTLTDSDLPIQSFSPTAARDLTLPSVASTNHAFYVINRSGTYSITVKNSGGTVIRVISPSKSTVVISDGANGWYVADRPRDTAYKVTPTASAGSLTLTLTHGDGEAPSAGRPLDILIDGVYRSVTASLTVTLSAGTNWASHGSSKFATLEHDWFVYAGYNATDGVVIGTSPICHARKYGDFSTTSTAETYCKISTITNAASSDPYTVIARFAATLSAGSAYTWTVPTYTSANLIQAPIYETEWRTWVSVPTQGYSTAPTGTVYQYQLQNSNCLISMRETTNGISNTNGAAIYPLPYTAKTISNGLWFGFAFIVNNSTTDAAGYCYVASGTSTISFWRSADAAYTSSGGRRVNLQSPFSYPIV